MNVRRAQEREENEMPEPLTAEEEAEVRGRNADVPWTAAWIGNGRPTDDVAWQALEDRRRLLATLDAVRSRPEPTDDERHLSFPPDPGRCYPGCAHQRSRPEPPDGLSDALIVAAILRGDPNTASLANRLDIALHKLRAALDRSSRSDAALDELRAALAEHGITSAGDFRAAVGRGGILNGRLAGRSDAEPGLREAATWRHSTRCEFERGGASEKDDCNCGLFAFRARLSGDKATGSRT